jgi:hypothetical protein
MLARGRTHVNPQRVRRRSYQRQVLSDCDLLTSQARRTVAWLAAVGVGRPSACDTSHPRLRRRGIRSAGATLLVDDGLIIGAHTHLVTDSGVSALDRVAGYSEEQIDEVITVALRAQLSAGVTTVRDLGARRFCVVQRRESRRGMRYRRK